MPESQCVLKEGWNRPSGATGLALLSLSFLYCVIAQWHSAPNLNCCHGVWCSGHGAPVFCVLSDGGSCCHASACLVVLIDYAWRMRRMNAFIAPSVIHDCHNLLRCATAGTTPQVRLDTSGGRPHCVGLAGPLAQTRQTNVMVTRCES